MGRHPMGNPLNGLTPKQVKVCAAWIYDRLTQQQIADQMGISQQAVYSIITRAKRRLEAKGCDVSRFQAAAT